jgi:hypothetical protein
MAAGDVTVTVVETPSAAEIDTALTSIRTAVTSSGTIGAFSLDGKVFCWGIEEA